MTSSPTVVSRCLARDRICTISSSFSSQPVVVVESAGESTDANGDIDVTLNYCGGALAQGTSCLSNASRLGQDIRSESDRAALDFEDAENLKECPRAVQKL